MSLKLFCPKLLALGRRRSVTELLFKSFSCSMRLAEDPFVGNANITTTDFGFKQVPKGTKESKGCCRSAYIKVFY